MEPTAPNSTAPSTAPSIDEQISEAMKGATHEEPDPIKRKANLDRLTALNQAKHPEPTQPEPGQAPVYEPPVPLTEAQAAIAQDYAADLHGLDVAGVTIEQKGTFLDFAIAGAVQDRVDLRDEDACRVVGRTRHGAQWDGLVEDAQRAVVALGPEVKDYLERTGSGNSPSVVEALALWQRGSFKLSPEQARERLKGEGLSAVETRLLHLLASRG